jgi:hypothetical protein
MTVSGGVVMIDRIMLQPDNSDYERSVLFQGSFEAQNQRDENEETSNDGISKLREALPDRRGAQRIRGPWDLEGPWQK